MKLPKTVLVSLLVCSSSVALIEAVESKSDGRSRRTEINIPPYDNVRSDGEKQYLQDLAVAEKSPGPDNEKLISALRTLAAVYRKSDRDKMTVYLKRAVDLDSKNGHASKYAGQLGLCYFETNDYAHAEPYLKLWLKQVEDDHNPDAAGSTNYSQITPLLYLAQNAMGLGKLKDAGVYFDRMRTLHDKAQRNYGSGVVYPPNFLNSYTGYLEKTGQTARAQEWRAYTTKLSQRKVKAYCDNCGRG